MTVTIPVSNDSSNFYSKFTKPAALGDLTPEEMTLQPPVAADAASPESENLLSKFIKNISSSAPTEPQKDYDFNLSPEEETPVKDITEVPAPRQGILRYLSQKGQKAYEMIHPALTDIVKKFEGFRDTAYLPTKNDVPTLGYGMTRGVKLGDTITKEEADKQLEQHLSEYQNEVKSMVKVPLTDNQLAAVTSLVYNVGPTAFRKSKALSALNEGDFDAFQKEAFDPEQGFVHQDGEILTGLVNRRKVEKELFNS